MGNIKAEDAADQPKQRRKSLSRRSSRDGAPQDESIAPPQETPAPSARPPPPTERKKLVAIASSNQKSSTRRPPSTGRKLSALSSAHKRRIDGQPNSSSKLSRQPQQTPQFVRSLPEMDAQETPAQVNAGSKLKAPPTTVAQAQETGEQARLHDETMWALEGLSASSLAAKQENLAILTEIYSRPRNRFILHTTALGDSFWSAIGKLCIGDDPVLALGAAAILLLSTTINGDPVLFAREDIGKLIANVLQVSSLVPAPSTSQAPSGRILRILHDPSLARSYLPREASYSPIAVMLAALVNTLNPNECPAEIDKIKHTMRTAGVLTIVAQMAADHAQALVDTSPTMETVQRLWRLDRCLVVLEHSCFACEENEQHLIESEVTMGVEPMVVRQSLVHFLINQMHAIGRQAVIAGLKKDCLRSALAVLMNMTHNNADGCKKLVSVSGLDTVCGVFARICQTQGVLGDPKELKAWMDELNGCLGVLINCAEDSKENCDQMRALELHGVSPSKVSPSKQPSEGMVRLLAKLISKVMVKESEGGQHEGHAEEVTLDALQHGEGEAAASIVEVYAAILLGFLVEGNKEAQKNAVMYLPGETMAPVVSAVQKCLQFYVAAGALTQRTEASLRALLASLQSDTGLF